MTLLSTASTLDFDFDSLEAHQQGIWASGDYGRIGVLFQIVAETLCEAVDLRAIDRVLDVAAGNGNASLAAARRYADVTSTDFVPEFLAQGLCRAEAEGLPILTRVADAEDLPFEDGEFDVALSTFGVMFAPDQERAAGEILRVVRAGGRIGLASWTPEGFMGELLFVIHRFVPPVPGLPSPAAWGSETRIARLFGRHASAIRTERKRFVFRNLCARHWVDTFRRYYGPVRRTFEALDAARQADFHAALLEILERHNRGGREALTVPAEYLEVVVWRA